MSFEFKAPVSHVLMVGTYTNATRAPFAQVGAGIDISGMGRGCNMERGDFTVRSVSIGPSGWFNAFDVTFSDICDGQAPLSGEVRYTRPTPGPNDGPQGTSIDATLPAPSAASAHMQGSTVIVTWTPPAGNNAWELFRTDGTASFATAVQVLAAGGPGQARDDMAVPGRTYTYFVATPAGGNHVSRPAQVTFTVPG